MYANNNCLLAATSIHTLSQFPLILAERPSTFFWRTCSFGSGVYYMFCRLCFTFHGPEGLEDARMSFLFHFLLFYYNLKPILPIFLARIPNSKLRWNYSVLLDVRVTKRVIGPLQAGRSTRYPATIETPDWCNIFLQLSRPDLKICLCCSGHCSVRQSCSV